MTQPNRFSCTLLFALAAAALWAQPAPAPSPPASLKGFGEDSTFYLYVNEDRVGTIKVKWLPGGSYQNEATLAMAGQSMTVTTSIAVDPDGIWTQFTAAAPAGTTTCVREGATARRTLKDKTTTFDVKPGARLFDNYGPTLMSQAVRLYDRAKGGKQPFLVIILPGVAMDASLEFKDQVERTVGNKDLTFLRYTYSLVGIDITLWTDADGRVYLGEVPSQHAAYVREGYEALRKEPVSDPLISQPKFEVKVEAATKIAMRDGMKLATDIYLPQAEGKVPVILIRTPYKKEMGEIQGRYYARRGYAVAIQDCRGRFGSEGVWEPFINEPKDGYDAVEWLAAQPWSNGKVGMIGGASVGWGVAGRPAWVEGEGRHDGRVLRRLGAVVGSQRAPATPGDHHSERSAAGPFLQHPLRARRLLHLRRHLVGGHPGIQSYRRFVGRRPQQDRRKEVRANAACAAGDRPGQGGARQRESLLAQVDRTSRG